VADVRLAHILTDAARGESSTQLVFPSDLDEVASATERTLATAMRDRFTHDAAWFGSHPCGHTLWLAFWQGKFAPGTCLVRPKWIGWYEAGSNSKAFKRIRPLDVECFIAGWERLLSYWSATQACSGAARAAGSQELPSALASGGIPRWV
jgi:hypothetical protein